MKVAVLGAGAGGASACVELSRQGHQVRLWNRSPAALSAFREKGGIRHQGVLGDGFTPLAAMSQNLGTIVAGVDVILVCLPTLVHASIAKSLSALGGRHIPVVLNPGHTGGALEFSEVFRQSGRCAPPIAEFSTLTYVARKPEPDCVFTSGRAKSVRLAALPGGEDAASIAAELYDCAHRTPDVLFTGLSNVNMVLHPPGAILGAAWIEATGGDFTFYVEGLTDGVARVMGQLDEERRAVGRAFGHDLPSLFEEMVSIGTIEPDVDPAVGLAAAIRAGKANRKITAPNTLSHRYYLEDFWYGLEPFLAFAAIADVATPVASSLMGVGTALLGDLAPKKGRSAAAMGIEKMNRDALVAKVREMVHG